MKHLSFYLIPVILLGIMVSCDDIDEGVDLSNKTWTLMFYFNGDNNLEENLLWDLNELEAVDLTDTGITIIALFDGSEEYVSGEADFEGTRVYEIDYDPLGAYNLEIVSTELEVAALGLTTTDDEELDVGSQAVLEGFVSFCHQNYPSDYSAIVFSSHGDGWRDLVNETALKAKFSLLGKNYDYYRSLGPDESSSLYGSYLYNYIVADVLEDSNIDLIAYDACLMGMVETAYQLRNSASYLVASEELVPGNGFSHDDWILSLRDSNIKTPENLAKIMVDSYENTYSGENGDGTCTLSATKLGDLDDIPSLLDAFTEDILADYTETEIWNIRTQSQTIAEIDADYLDLYSFANNFSDYSSAQSILDKLEEIIIYEWHETGYNSYVLDAHGLSINFPSNPYWLETDYLDETIALSEDSNWDGFIYQILTGSSIQNDEEDDAGDEPDSAVEVTLGTGTSQTVENYIYVSWDIDVYSFNVSENGYVGIYLTDVPEGCDFDIYLFHQNGTVSSVASSYDGYEGEDEMIVYHTSTGDAAYNEECGGMTIFTNTYGSALGTGTYYVAVSSYTGNSQSQKYSLTIQEYDACEFSPAADID